MPKIDFFYHRCLTFAPHVSFQCFLPVPLKHPVTSTFLTPKHKPLPLTSIQSLSLPYLLFSPSSSTLSICKMSTSSAKSSFQGGPTLRRKRIVRCGCGDVCKVSVARTPENYGKKFYGCPNYKVEEEDCGFFKWYNEEYEVGAGAGAWTVEDFGRNNCRSFGSYFCNGDNSCFEDVNHFGLAFGRMFGLTWILVFSCKWKYNAEVG
uniref:GRF-type domain-containing protein n=1 Tax=Lactuca sativa TaxID=4236 RepID=A0A9R1V9Q5_LACSA|nr:hypothetical protein LSAT_V11C600331930 [Lactuca sativa]